MSFAPRLPAQALQCALDEAQQALDEARRRCAGLGLEPADTRAELERHLSAQELADVYADVEAQLLEIVRIACLAGAEPRTVRAARRHSSTV